MVNEVSSLTENRRWAEVAIAELPFGLFVRTVTMQPFRIVSNTFYNHIYFVVSGKRRLVFVFSLIQRVSCCSLSSTQSVVHGCWCSKITCGVWFFFL